MSASIPFGFENMAWPTLLLDVRGAVLSSNAAAAAAFGKVLDAESPKLSEIWPLENGMAAGDFLGHWEKSPTPVMNLKFRTGNGVTMDYTTSVSAFKRNGHNLFVLQLLSAFAPVTQPPPEPTPAPEPAPVEVEPPEEISKPAAKVEPVVEPKVVEPPPAPAAQAAETKSLPNAGDLVSRQKLDCALQLARTVSLDFNNALTSILGHASFLLSKAEAGHPWRHSLMEVEKSAARAAEIAHELQTFSRQEKETHRAPPGNLNVVVNRCVDFFRNTQGEKIAWNLQLEKGLFAARFDEQALTKILENAVEAVGGTGKISVQSRNMDLAVPMQDGTVHLAPGTYACIEITDSGAGIASEVLPRIFEPFFTTKGKNHRGLGLALVYGIVTNHGGMVAVSGQPGKGASARIYLPAEKQFVHDDADANQNLHGTETILVVDDETMLLSMTETILSDSGYKVLTANNGTKALAVLSRDDVDVDMVVTDMVMPGMGGRELVERIRQLAPKIRILCTSGYVMPADKKSGTAYMQKPFTSDDLLAKVKQVLTMPDE
jgi:signal transduction histidine kinase/CheY-like chemotaxis protein